MFQEVIGNHKILRVAVNRFQSLAIRDDVHVDEVAPTQFRIMVPQLIFGHAIWASS